jgi:hypothetical protein
MKRPFAPGVALATIVSAIALGAGCFSPDIASPGYFCHPDDVPACPDGETCVSGRCIRPDFVVHLDGGVTNPTLDLSVPGGPKDLSGPLGPVDLAKGLAADGCAAFMACFGACTSNACVSGCMANVSAMGMSLAQTALNCEQMFCLNRGDCKVDSTGMSLVDGTGKPAGTCDNCLNDATAQLSGGTCANPASVTCNPSSCSSQVTACLSN